MSRHLSFYNNDTLLQDNTEPGYFTEFTVPDNTNLIVCYDDDYKITCNIRVTASSNQDIINYQFATDSAVFLLKSLQNYTQNQTVRAQITVSNIAKDSNNIAQDIQNYLQTCGVGSGTSIDFSTIVTALNSITTALSALTNLSNLSNLADLANIITAIQNKDNQSRIVQELEDIFVYENVDNSKRYSSMKYNFIGNRYSSDITNQLSIISKLQTLCNCFLNSNLSVTNTSGITVSNRLLSLLASLNNVETNGNISNNLNAVSARSKLNYISDIETKLEQNLPFTTIVENSIVETNVAQNCSYSSKIEQIPFSE